MAVSVDKTSAIYIIRIVHRTKLKLFDQAMKCEDIILEVS